MAYSSEINLGGLGESPKTTNPDIFPDMTDVYNAIHILAQWTDSLVVRARHGEDSKDNPNWENFPVDKFWWGKAAVKISEGQICGSSDIFIGKPGKPNSYSLKGVVLGASGVLKRQRIRLQVGTHGGDSGDPIYEDVFINKFTPRGITGIAMNDANPGEWVRLAVGEGVIQLSGAKAGDKILAYASFTHTFTNNVGYGYRGNGSLVKVDEIATVPFIEGIMQIGVGTGDDEFLFYGSSALPVMVNAWGDL
jgi:hypothetical protein